jgi:4-amino-4-deoxy-L-arabinose transferase-like glycosyltransferase
MPSNLLPPRPTALLLLLVAALLMLGSGALPLVGPDEPRYVRVAVEMQRSGDWITPTLQGRPWLEKPVLFYWLAGLSMRAFGEHAWAARLPVGLAGLLLVGATALVGARLFGAAAGLHAGFVAGTSLLFFIYAHAAAMDMLLAASLTLGLGLVLLRRTGLAGVLALDAAAACFGLATLAKGPLGLLLPALVIGADALLARDGRLLREVLRVRRVLVFVLVAGPWYALVLHAQGMRFVDDFLLNHNLQRFTSTIHNHPGPPWYYLPVLIVGLFPWTGLLLPALGTLRPARTPAERFVLLWLLVPLIFFSLAGSKLPGYIVPCLPPLALLLGRCASGLQAATLHVPVWAGARAVALVGLLLGALVVMLPAQLYRLGDPGWAASLPLAAWSLLAGLLASRAWRLDAGQALRVMRVGAAGTLALTALVAGPILARLDSGRELFAPAAGQEVLVWNAWRTAWMAGYFYNDARVRELRDLAELGQAVQAGPRLVLCGPAERRRLLASAAFVSSVLAEGPRGHVLLRVQAR